MSDMTCNDKAQAAMRERNSANLNTSGKAGVVVRSPKQVKKTYRSTNHVEVGTGRKS
jgi:hypothetical protein